MNDYRTYFHQTINKIAHWLFIISAIGIVIDTQTPAFGHSAWINYLNYPILLVAVVGYMLYLFRLITSRILLLIFSYAFTVFFYVPGIVDPAINNTETLYYFSKIYCCIIYIFFAALTGMGKHVLYLGGLNLALYLTTSLQFTSIQGSFYIDYINVFTLIVVPVVIFIVFRLIDSFIKNTEAEKHKTKEAEKNILNFKIDEENKRNHFLSVIQQSDIQLLNELSEKMNGLMKLDNVNEIKNEILSLKKKCHLFLYNAENSENARWQKHTDVEFIAGLKSKYPQLTAKEQYICSLIRLRLSSKEIAEKQGLSVESVKWHRKNIRKKLNIPDNKSLIEFVSTNSNSNFNEGAI
ncbi:MAG: helix-turn-helix transcriptional regulator [Paludibacteraceae bacterium]|nr:helix-turn-helix transcriptional regulator [Paludibacteraceae bacterium]